jgi:hypothetical protein
VKSLGEYTQLIESVQQLADAPIWFRGVGLSTYTLTPSRYRHPTTTDISQLIELEESLLTRFRHRSIPYQTRPLNDPWELLFMMQHFGVPTRLLDWSENPFIALYFAIVDAERKMVAGSFAADAAVWILNTRLWNGAVLTPYWRGRVLAIPDNPLDGYTPGSDLKRLAVNPVAMAGLHNSPRIVAQRGAFTIFGQTNKPMEKIYEDNAFPKDALVKVNLPGADLPKIRDALFGIGYADSMIYPDLAGLAKEIKRHFGFGV